MRIKADGLVSFAMQRVKGGRGGRARDAGAARRRRGQDAAARRAGSATAPVRSATRARRSTSSATTGP